MRHKKLLFTIALLLAIGQGAWAYDKCYNINTNDGNVVVGAIQDVFIEGTGETTSNQIEIKSGGTVTLHNVNISNVEYCIRCDGNATIILEDGTENTLTSTGDYSHDLNNGNHPALRVGSSGSTLTIKGGPLGTGILNAYGSANHAAIGGGSQNSDYTCGNIRIEGGVINARGGEWAAAIGSDRYRNGKSTCGDITITGGTVTAWGGINAAAIGSGCDGGCGKVTITNGVAKVLAIKGTDAPYSIGVGKSEDQTSTCGTVTTNCTLDGSNPVGGQTGFIANNYAFVTTSEQLTEAAGIDNTDIVLGADIDINSVLIIDKTTNLDLNGHTLTRKGAEGDKDNGWVVWVKSTGNLTIKDTGTGGTITGGYAYNGAGIYNEGTLTIEGGTISGNTVVDKSGVDGRGGGIFNKSGATLTITGGTITGNAAIGSAHGGAGIFNDGTLTITGGTVTGNTASHGGGIKSYGTLNMKGAPVVSGNTGGDVWLGNGKVITCTGAFTGSVNSIGIAMERVGVFTSGYSTTGTETNPFFASTAANDIVSTDSELKLRIGYYECSWDATNKQLVHTLKHIDGDVTYLTGGDNANIGTTGSDSWYFVDDNINYSMRVWCYGNVHIILGDNAQMIIGHGLKVFGANTTQNVSLKIYSQSYGDDMGRLISHCDAKDEAGIGSVASTKMGPVEFHGGYIEAEGDTNAAGIGGGKNANSDVITIYDGIIKATSGKDAAAIGGGSGGSAESITIYGGDVTADATTSSPIVFGAGIGGGAYESGGGGCGVINIWGGTVTAKGASYSPGIGSGYEGKMGGEINIHGGTIVACGGMRCGIGIGSGGAFLRSSLPGGTIRISGGDVKAYGKEGGVGIGTYYGDCNIEISGGTVYAEGSNGPFVNTYDGAGIGGVKVSGKNLDRAVNVTITGGDVTAVSPNGAINFVKTVTITGHKVKVGADKNNTTPVTATEIVEACGKNVYAKIEVCTDHHCNFGDVNVTETTHSGKCIYCGAAVAGKHEIPAGTGVCSICGYGSGTWSVRFIVPNLKEDGYCIYENGNPVYQATATTAFRSKEFYLPVCNYIPKGYVFAGWEVGETVTSLVADDNVTLLQPGDAYTPTADVSFTAHFLPLTIELADGSDNTAVIWQNEGKTATSVTLTGRTLYKDGKWNTLCLPFDIEDFDGTIFKDATVKTLGNSTGCTTGFNESTGTLTLDFVDANAIEAGVAYIVKWADGENISNPTFTDVTIENEAPADHAVVSSDETVSFVGTYSPMTFVETVKSILFLGGDNTLYYPQPDTTTDPDNPVYPVIGAQRAYFQLNGITAGEAASPIRAFVLNFGDDGGSAGVSPATIADEGVRAPEAWYSLDGRRMIAKPTAKGLYIYKGRKTIIK